MVFADEGLENKAVKTKRQGNIDTEEAEGYNKNIEYRASDMYLAESPSQVSEIF